MATNVTIEKTEVLSDEKYPLKKVSFTRQQETGGEQKKNALVFYPGDAATILLYNRVQKTVLLTKQFRLPSYLNGNETGLLLETCAGKIDDESPEEAIKREVEEETGYRIHEVQKLFQAYTSPGAVSELLHFYAAPYAPEDKVSAGGGLKEEQEFIEIVEVDFEQAISMIKTGGIQDVKTITLLLYVQMQGYLS